MSKIRDIDLNPAVFGKMHNLRLLKIYNSHFMKQCKLHFPQGLRYLPDELRYLHWYGYPLNSLPSDFNPENLVVLEMPHNQIEKLWNEDQVCSDYVNLCCNCQIKRSILLICVTLLFTAPQEVDKA